MGKIIDGVIDSAKSILIGFSAGSVIGVIFTLIGLIIYKGHWIDAFGVGRKVVIVTGALGLLVSSGALLKRDNLKPLKDIDGWKRNFKVLNFAYVLLLLFIGLIIAGGMLDYIRIYLNNKI